MTKNKVQRKQKYMENEGKKILRMIDAQAVPTVWDALGRGDDEMVIEVMSRRKRMLQQIKERFGVILE